MSINVLVQDLSKGVLLNIVGDDATQQKALSKLIDGKYGLVSARLLVTGGDILPNTSSKEKIIVLL